MQRVVELLLVAAIVVGSVLLWRLTSKRDQLTREHQRLEAMVGSLPIKDQSKVHIRAIATDHPWDFAWRIYFPANYQFTYSTSSGSGSSQSSSPIEGVLRMRLREVDGQLYIYEQLDGSSGRWNIGGKQLASLLREYPEQKLLIEQIGVDQMQVIEPSEVRTLLKVTLPPEMQAAAKKQLSTWEYQRITPHLEDYRFGPPGFLEQEEAARKPSRPSE